jgi:hypothetical protein
MPTHRCSRLGKKEKGQSIAIVYDSGIPSTLVPSRIKRKLQMVVSCVPGASQGEEANGAVHGQPHGTYFL